MRRNPKETQSKLIKLFALAVLLLALPACESRTENAVEDVGEAVEDAADEATDAVKDATR